MARPETPADLREDLHWRTVATFYDVVLTDPAQLRAMAATIDSALNLGGTATSEPWGNGVTVRVPVAPEVLEVRLKSAQDDWARRELGWRNAIEGIAYVKPGWERAAIDAWAKAEERVAVDWPKEEVPTDA